jgi:DNA-binding LacI/PurR family transcriptional regulator
VRTPRAQIGVAAADMLLSIIRQGAHHPRWIDLGFQVIARDSG